MRSVFLGVLLAAAGCSPGEAAKGPPPAKGPENAKTDASWKPEEGAELLGTAAPELTGLTDWTNSPPLTLAALRGRPVLVRFWTTGCHLCKHTAPALVEMDRRFKDKGLVVIGIHHPKEPESRNADVWRKVAVEYGFRFALAQDQEWATVNSWWLEREKQHSFTSATFLLDRAGKIRWLHPGGEFFDGEGEPGAAYRSLVAAVEQVVAEGASK